ncbi:MAG: YciC family protein [Balneola sp.]|jgi:hypothetical protein|tara:strand:- start:22183 stop:23022 length:840 start_codon:yes stop_codon:yes gene_type:complete
MSNFIFKKPRDLGGILSDTFLYIRQNYISLGKPILYFVVPFYVVQAFILQEYSSGLFDSISEIGTTSASFNSLFGWEYFLNLILSMVAVSALSVITLKHFKLTSSGKENDLEHITSGIFPLIVWMGLLFIVIYLSITIGFFLFIIPGIYIAIKLSFTPAIFILEKKDIFDSMKRSWEISKGFWWITFALLIVIYFMVYFASLAVGLPIGLIYAFAFDGGLVESSSGVFSTIISILTALSSVITTGFYAAMHIAFALHFYNIDERKEGGNLRSRIEGLSD